MTDMRRSGLLKGSSSIDRTSDCHVMADASGEAPAFTVDGIPAIPGESWQDYHQRALAWITIESRTIPANRRSMSRWVLAGMIAMAPFTAYLVIRI